MPGGILSFLIFFPIVAGIFIGIASSNNFIRERIKFLLYYLHYRDDFINTNLFFSFDKQNVGFNLLIILMHGCTFETFKAQYLVGIDGLSAPLVLLTGIFRILCCNSLIKDFI